MTVMPSAGVASAGRSGALPYSPSPFVKLSCAAHVAGAAALAVDPAFWPWVLGGVALNHGVIATAGLMPRNRWLGENWTRLPAEASARGEVAITLDDGPDPAVTPRVLDLLDRLGVKASFFLIGRHAEAHPALVRAMVERGHGVENHTFGHPASFSFYGPRRFHDEIRRAQESLAGLCGRAPRFFRPPAGLRNVLLYPVLARLGLIHASWTRRGLERTTRLAGTVVERLGRDLRGGDILLLHDGDHRGRPAPPLILDVLPALIDRIRAAGLRPVALSAPASV
jgi:peptidoglycan/xylan/chitin deacetylase (PgdA/CDA1 family)